jgi:hypothetical protein
MFVVLKLLTLKYHLLKNKGYRIILGVKRSRLVDNHPHLLLLLLLLLFFFFFFFFFWLLQPT